MQKKVLFFTNRFPSLRTFVNKKSWKSKKIRPLIINFKNCILVGLSFFKFQLFLLTKVLREGNLFVKKKIPSSVNSALVKFFNQAKISYFWPLSDASTVYCTVLHYALVGSGIKCNAWIVPLLPSPPSSPLPHNWSKFFKK